MLSTRLETTFGGGALVFQLNNDAVIKADIVVVAETIVIGFTTLSRRCFLSDFFRVRTGQDQGLDDLDIGHHAVGITDEFGVENLVIDQRLCISPEIHVSAVDKINGDGTHANCLHKVIDINRVANVQYPFYPVTVGGDNVPG